jgi:multiple sugar transport system permease protein
MRSSKRSPALLIVVLSVLGVFAVVPFLWLVFGALKSPQEIRQVPPTFFPTQWRFDNFLRIFTVPKQRMLLHRYYFNSMFIAAAQIVMVLFTSSLIGYVFAKFDFKGKNLFFWFIMSTMIVPFQVTMIPGYLILAKLRLIDTLWALIVPAAIDAFGIFLMRQFMFSVPEDLMDSARIDGASEWLIYRRIVVPQLGASFATLGMLTFLASWNAYLWPMIVLKSDRRRTLPIILYFFQNQQVQRLELIMAASILIIAPMMIVFVASQKWIIRGFTLTGLKE